MKSGKKGKPPPLGRCWEHSLFIFCFSCKGGVAMPPGIWPETSLFFIFFHKSSVYSINQPAFVYNFTQTRCKINKKRRHLQRGNELFNAWSSDAELRPEKCGSCQPELEAPNSYTIGACAATARGTNWDNWREYLGSREKKSSNVCGSPPPESLNALFWHLTHKCLVVCCCYCCFSDLYVTPEVVT